MCWGASNPLLLAHKNNTRGTVESAQEFVRCSDRVVHRISHCIPCTPVGMVSSSFQISARAKSDIENKSTLRAKSKDGRRALEENGRGTAYIVELDQMVGPPATLRFQQLSAEFAEQSWIRLPPLQSAVVSSSSSPTLAWLRASSLAQMW